jgi:hypothetical protein
VNRESIIKGLAVLTAIVLVLFIGFLIVNTYLGTSKSELRAEAAAPVTLDANEALKATIDTLEISWQAIQSYSFRVSQDPLHLGRVVKDFSYAQAGFKETEEEDNIRLTATVVDEHPKAIIKFRGKSYVVQVGEYIEQIYRVDSIEKKQVVLTSGGSRIVLVNKPVQGLEDEDGGDSNYSNSDDGGNSNY